MRERWPARAARKQTRSASVKPSLRAWKVTSEGFSAAGSFDLDMQLTHSVSDAAEKMIERNHLLRSMEFKIKVKVKSHLVTCLKTCLHMHPWTQCWSKPVRLCHQFTPAGNIEWEGSKGECWTHRINGERLKGKCWTHRINGPPRNHFGFSSN